MGWLKTIAGFANAFGGDFYAAHNDGKELAEKALQSMGFYNEEGLLVNGALMVADDYQEKKQRYNVLCFPVLIKVVRELLQ